MPVLLSLEGVMTRPLVTALRELLKCIDDYDLQDCSLGDHAVHDATERGAAAIVAGWAALDAWDELLEAADALVELHGIEPGTVSTATVAEAVERLASLVAEARGEAVTA